jgi:hypothetical protein
MHAWSGRGDILEKMPEPTTHDRLNRCPLGVIPGGF